jgi:hypothetical protein
MLALQIRVLMAWQTARQRAKQRLGDELERGEVTATMAMIAILVAGALVAAALIVRKMQQHATAVP